jgi:hypothetical protein
LACWCPAKYPARSCDPACDPARAARGCLSPSEDEMGKARVAGRHMLIGPSVPGRLSGRATMAHPAPVGSCIGLKRANRLSVQRFSTLHKCSWNARHPRQRTQPSHSRPGPRQRVNRGLSRSRSPLWTDRRRMSSRACRAALGTRECVYRRVDEHEQRSAINDQRERHSSYCSALHVTRPSPSAMVKGGACHPAPNSGWSHEHSPYLEGAP